MILYLQLDKLWKELNLISGSAISYFYCEQPVPESCFIGSISVSGVHSEIHNQCVSLLFYKNRNILTIKEDHNKRGSQSKIILTDNHVCQLATQEYVKAREANKWWNGLQSECSLVWIKQLIKIIIYNLFLF